MCVPWCEHGRTLISHTKFSTVSTYAIMHCTAVCSFEFPRDQLSILVDSSVDSGSSVIGIVQLGRRLSPNPHQRIWGCSASFHAVLGIVKVLNAIAISSTIVYRRFKFKIKIESAVRLNSRGASHGIDFQYIFIV